MQKLTRKTGFTLVELSLSIVFIAILSLVIILVITDTISSYRRGLTLNQVNTMGTDIVDDIMASVQSAPAQSLKEECGNFYAGKSTAQSRCEGDYGLNFMRVVRKGSVSIKGTTISSIPLYGAFCTGNYSYIWNSGYFSLADISEDVTVGGGIYRAELYFTGGSEEKKYQGDIKLIKIKDEGRSICRSVMDSGSYPVITSSSTLSSAKSSKFKINIAEDSNIELLPEELIAKENNLALYDLDIGHPAIGANSRSMLYSVSFILGTIQGGINIKLSGDNCAAPTDAAKAEIENFDYCSINKFNFAAQAIGG